MASILAGATVSVATVLPDPVDDIIPPLTTKVEADDTVFVPSVIFTPLIPLPVVITFHTEPVYSYSSANAELKYISPATRADPPMPLVGALAKVPRYTPFVCPRPEA
jgi:hypothetical protein